MTSLLSVWDAMIRAYRDSHMSDSWVVRILGIWLCISYGACICRTCIFVCNYSNMFYKL
jgi:hypothetical protein